ncbi:MAG: MBL fold metallo-hydrolase [Planctomycetia bacterium]|nr:MBL fold metallo-hydrolase [Planctomycetia bacterium]
MKRRDFCKLVTAAGTLPFAGTTLAAEESPEVGKPFPAWKEGEMELHFIYTGVGENAFYIFPDGTSLLMDTGDRDWEHDKKRLGFIDILPDASRRPGEWVARYVERVNPSGKNVDYLVLSHFHADHCGYVLGQAPMTQGRGENYCLTGLAEVGEFLHFDTAMDRCSPDYENVTPEWTRTSPEFQFYTPFIRYKQKTDGLKLEKFEVGKQDQIQLRKNAAKFPDFHVRNLCSNGSYWTGNEGEVIDVLAMHPKNAHRGLENPLSLAAVFSYGPFRFYTGGDLTGHLLNEAGQNYDYEGCVGRVAGPVDVCKGNHHSYRDAMVPSFVREIQSTVYVLCVWDVHHIQDNTMTNMTSRELYPGDRLICPTFVPKVQRELYQDKAWWSDVVTCGGHVVVKVLDGGKQYKVYYLSANDENHTVKAVFGPFQSKGEIA